MAGYLADMNIVSTCPHCGAPIYEVGDGCTTVPVIRYTCECRNEAWRFQRPVIVEETRKTWPGMA